MLSGKKQLKQTIAGHLKTHSSQRIRTSDLPLTKPENKTADKESEKKNTPENQREIRRASRVYPVHSSSNAAPQESPLVSQPEETFSTVDTNLSFEMKTARPREIQEIPTPLGY